jgi:hypothetical protein
VPQECPVPFLFRRRKRSGGERRSIGRHDLVLLWVVLMPEERPVLHPEGVTPARECSDRPKENQRVSVPAKPSSWPVSIGPLAEVLRADAPWKDAPWKDAGPLPFLHRHHEGGNQKGLAVPRSSLPGRGTMTDELHYVLQGDSFARIRRFVRSSVPRADYAQEFRDLEERYLRGEILHAPRARSSLTGRRGGVAGREEALPGPWRERGSPRCPGPAGHEGR